MESDDVQQSDGSDEAGDQPNDEKRQHQLALETAGAPPAMAARITRESQESAGDRVQRDTAGD